MEEADAKGRRVRVDGVLGLVATTRSRIFIARWRKWGVGIVYGEVGITVEPKV